MKLMGIIVVVAGLGFFGSSNVSTKYLSARLARPPDHRHHPPLALYHLCLCSMPGPPSLLPTPLHQRPMHASHPGAAALRSLC
eukprot:1150376-Pelagomonas_calceolata.AAC.1